MHLQVFSHDQIRHTEAANRQNTSLSVKDIFVNEKCPKGNLFSMLEEVY